MADTRKKNVVWEISADANGTYSYNAAHLAVLMDIRDELQSVNRILQCPNFRDLPRTLKRLDTRLRVKEKLLCRNVIRKS